MARLRLSALAQADIVNVLAWTAQRFGDQAQARYEQLLANALRDLGAEPLRLGTAARPELGHGVRSYHLRHSRKRLEVARPRHLIVYRIAEARSSRSAVSCTTRWSWSAVAFDFTSEP